MEPVETNFRVARVGVARGEKSHVPSQQTGPGNVIERHLGTGRTKTQHRATAAVDGIVTHQLPGAVNAHALGVQPRITGLADQAVDDPVSGAVQRDEGSGRAVERAVLQRDVAALHGHRHELFLRRTHVAGSFPMADVTGVHSVDQDVFCG